MFEEREKELLERVREAEAREEEEKQRCQRIVQNNKYVHTVCAHAWYDATRNLNPASGIETRLSRKKS